MFKHNEILDRLERIEQRLDGIETRLASVAREEELRERLEDKTQELDSMAQQGLHIVELLDEARRRIREFEADGA